MGTPYPPESLARRSCLVIPPLCKGFGPEEGTERWGRVVQTPQSFLKAKIIANVMFLPPLAPPYKGGELSNTCSTPLLPMLYLEAAVLFSSYRTHTNFN